MLQVVLNEEKVESVWLIMLTKHSLIHGWIHPSSIATLARFLVASEAPV